MSRDIPILFSAPMVRANLAGTKTQTRRPLYVMTKGCASATMHRNYLPPAQLPPVDRGWTLSQWFKAKAGDRLWQRETWAPQVDCEASAARWTIDWPIQHGPKPIVHFCSDNTPRAWVTKWRPSIHMPRWACRFEALITEVRIERLQAITEADAIAEGIEENTSFCGHRLTLPGGRREWRAYGYEDTQSCTTAVASYHCLWDSINGDTCPWSSNPWVVAITYERIKP